MAGGSQKQANQPINSKRRGRGIAGGFKNVGFSFGFPEHCWAKLELRGQADIDQVILYHAGADVGQGAHTALCQMAADAVGLPFDAVEIVASDTASSGSSGSASASRLSFMSGNAILGAAEIALRKWAEEERPAVGEFMYHPPPTTPFDADTGRAEPNFAYGYVAEAVELELDIETGQVQLVGNCLRKRCRQGHQPAAAAGSNRRRNHTGTRLRLNGISGFRRRANPQSLSFDILDSYLA